MERVKNIENKLAANNGTEIASIVKNSMEKMEGKIEEKIGSGLASYASVAQDAVQGWKPKEQNQEPKMMKDIIKEAMAQQAEEEKDIERRSTNIIIYRVPETAASGNAGSETGETSDRTYLKELMEGPLELKHATDPIKQITRLGKRGDGSAARPMLVKLTTNAIKAEIMENLKKLRNADEKFKRISVAHDLTAKQREAIKGALEAARREQDAKATSSGGLEAGNWKFRVVDQQNLPRVIRVKVG